MNEDQIRILLQDLATVGGLPDPDALVEGRRLRLGDLTVVLEHTPEQEPDVLCVRVHLGKFEEAHRGAITTALLETNFIHGGGGNFAFSLVPMSSEAVLTMRTPLQASMTAQALWQALSNITSHGDAMWKQVTSIAGVLHDRGALRAA